MNPIAVSPRDRVGGIGLQLECSKRHFRCINSQDSSNQTITKLEQNLDGLKEDQKALHLALSSFVFYALFTIERVGTYILDLVQTQFEYDVMK